MNVLKNTRIGIKLLIPVLLMLILAVGIAVSSYFLISEITDLNRTISKSITVTEAVKVINADFKAFFNRENEFINLESRVNRNADLLDPLTKKVVTANLEKAKEVSDLFVKNDEIEKKLCH